MLFNCILPQATLDSEKQRADETDQKYKEAQEMSEERLKKLEETEKKAHHLQESLRGQYISSIMFFFMLEESDLITTDELLTRKLFCKLLG